MYTYTHKLIRKNNRPAPFSYSMNKQKEKTLTLYFIKIMSI